MQPFTVLHQDRIIDEPYCKIDKQLVAFPDGSTGDWFIKRNNDAVIVIPLDAEQKILLQQTYKHGGGTIVTEFCAGLIDDGETPIQAAARELAEETGYQAKRFEPIGHLLASPTGTDMAYYFFVAIDCRPLGTTNREPAEQIQTFWVQDQATAQKKLLDAQPNVSASTMAAWAFFCSKSFL